jgi:hypothetical protein
MNISGMLIERLSGPSRLRRWSSETVIFGETFALLLTQTLTGIMAACCFQKDLGHSLKQLVMNPSLLERATRKVVTF